MLDLEDNSLHRLTTHEKGSSYPRWSPDGRFLAFLSGRIKENQIWLLNMEHGGEANQITDWKQGIEEFSWSPDGRHIVFVSNRTGDDDNNDNTDIWIVSSEGGESQQITTNVGADSSPRWSPDGRFIAYVSNQKNRGLVR